MNKVALPFVVIGVIAFIIATQAFFVVDQTQQAIVLQLGQPKGESREPGLHMKLPIVQDVRYFDRRILSVDPRPEQVVISSASLQTANEDDTEEEKANKASINNVTGEPIILDTFARYKIVDPLQFLKTLRTIGGANSRLESILKNATKAALGKTSLEQLLSPARDDVMSEIQKRVNFTVQKDKLGIEIVDVRIVRADLTSELRTSTVRRMISELKERATETRANGDQRAREISSQAEKKRTVLIAESQRDSEIIKGEGDRLAIKIYADAFNKDKDFYGFLRSMEAYKTTLSDPETRLILSPDSGFFHYFQDLKGR